MYALNLGSNNEVLSVTYPQYAPNAPTVDALPDGDITDYDYVNGELVLNAERMEQRTDEPMQEPTQLDRIEEMLDTLLGVTE